MIKSRLAVLLLCLITGIVGGCSYQQTTNGKNQTCRKCGSYRYYSVINTKHGPFKRTEIEPHLLYKSPQYDTCTHSWKDGEECIGGMLWDEGQVILLKKGRAFGAIVPKKRTDGVYDFTWYYRTDGKGTFHDADFAHFKTGVTTLHAEVGEYPYGVISFGPFRVTWVGIGAKYSHSAGEKVGRDDQKLGHAGKVDIQQVDAANIYFMGSGSDLGVFGDGSR